MPKQQTNVANAPKPSRHDPDVRPLMVGASILFTDASGLPRAAIATSDEREDGSIDLTYFPPGVHPIPLTGVAFDATGEQKFAWRKR